MAFSKAVSHQSPTDFNGVGCTPETPERNPNWEKKTQEQLPVMGQQEHGIFSGAIQNFFTPQDPISLFLLPRHTKGLWDVLVPRAGIR